MERPGENRMALKANFCYSSLHHHIHLGPPTKSSQLPNYEAVGWLTIPVTTSTVRLLVPVLPRVEGECMGWQDDSSLRCEFRGCTYIPRYAGYTCSGVAPDL